MKNKIIAQSIELFEKKGFSQTSIQDIVSSLGVTKGTFYYYFTSKEELLMDIHLTYIDDLIRRQKGFLDDPEKTCKEKLKNMMYLLISDIKHQGANANVFFREMRHLNEENANGIKEKREMFRLNLEKLLKEGVKSDEFKDSLQVDMVAFGILGMTNWSYQWFHPDGKVTDRELTEIYLDMLLNGIEK